MSEFLHVSLRSRNRDRTSEWYCKNLGFEERRRGRTEIGTQTAILVLPGNNTYIEVSDRVKLGHDSEIPEELILLQFTVADMRQTYERLTRNGVKWTEGGPDSEYCFVEDADGYEIELVEGDEPNLFGSFGIRVSDLDRSARFYTENLGFREVRRWQSPRGTHIAVLELPGNTTRLALRYMPFLDPTFSVPEDLMHMAFPVPDMQTFWHTMTERGIQFTEGGPDQHMVFAADPDGYELELIERKPAA
jgi:lactoylglutathione lyase